MKKQILNFPQHPNNKQTYELFVSSEGDVEELFRIKQELEKKLFKTEMKGGILLAKFNGEYLVVVNMEFENAIKKETSRCKNYFLGL